MKKKKANNQFFVPHNILEEAKFKKMPLSAQILYIHLCRLKNRLKTEPFYRDLETLKIDTGLGISTLKRAKKYLVDNLYIDITRDYYSHSGFRSADRFNLNGYRFLDNS